MIVLLLLTGPVKFDQFVAVRLSFCCNIHPGEGDNHDTITLLPDRLMLSSGAPSVCTSVIKLQNPPVTEKLPPLKTLLASGCPTVPLTEYVEPVLVPPPAAILDQSIEYCAMTGKQNENAVMQKLNASRRGNVRFACALRVGGFISPLRLSG